MQPIDPKIKDVYITLPGYNVNHKAFDEDSNNYFAGRKNLINRFLGFLQNGSNGGAYLVTGYRGIGKTSFVNKVLADYKKSLERPAMDSIVVLLTTVISCFVFISTLFLFVFIREIVPNMDRILLFKCFFGSDAFIKHLNHSLFYLIFRLTIAVIFLVFISLSPLIAQISVIKYNEIINFCKTPEVRAVNKKVIKFIKISAIGLVALTIVLVIVIWNMAISSTPEEEIVNWLNVIICTWIILLSISFGPAVICLIIKWLREENKIASDNSYFDLVTIRINLGSKETKRIEILRQIIHSVRRSVHDSKRTELFKNVLNPIALPYYTVLLSLVILVLFITNGMTFTGVDTRVVLSVYNTNYLFLLVFSFAYIFVVLISVLMINRWFDQRHYLFAKLTNLYDRCNSEVLASKNGSKLFDYFPMGFISRRDKRYIDPDPDEIENELIRILDKIVKLPGKRPLYIVVFDEIDKLDLYNSDGGSDQGASSRLLSMEMLSKLKYLITSAKCRFVFIAGRELFDATLADVADRKSKLSSVFSATFYVNSFYHETTDSLGGKSIVDGYTAAFEEVIKTFVFSSKESRMRELMLNTLITTIFSDIECVEGNNCKDVLDAIKQKIKYQLYAFVVFLTYRSNGSPKKLVKLIEDHIVIYKDIAGGENFNTIAVCKNYNKVVKVNHPNYCIKQSDDAILFVTDSCPPNSHMYVLRLTYYDQYRINFINYLYRPFLILNGKHYKNFHDHVLVSSTYLFDHILKFHPFAFSMSNLESIPEVLDESRSGNLRNFLESLVSYFMGSHLRETEVSLFNYKFYNRTAQELTLLGKIFEDEYAAFNFTLKETDSIKKSIQDKLKSIRQVYIDYRNTNSPDDSYVYSIFYYSEILGDVYFFDQEHDMALSCYFDAIQAMGKLDYNQITAEEFVGALKLRLKVALSYEKLKVFDMAMAQYKECISMYLMMSKFRSSLAEKMHKSGFLGVAYQPFIAQLFLKEKLLGVQVVEEDLKSMINMFNSLSPNLFSLNSRQQINILIYGSLGELLFYKGLFYSETPEKTESFITKYLGMSASKCYLEAIKCTNSDETQNNNHTIEYKLEKFAKNEYRHVNYLSRLGDILISESVDFKAAKEEIIAQVNPILSNSKQRTVLTDPPSISISLYEHCLNKFCEQGKYFNAVFQIKKIFRIYRFLGTEDNYLKHKDKLHQLFLKGLKLCDASAGYTQDTQIRKMDPGSDLGNRMKDTHYFYYSGHPEVAELTYIYYSLVLYHTDTYMPREFSEYGLISSKYSRIFELIYICENNYKLIKSTPDYNKIYKSIKGSNDLGDLVTLISTPKSLESDQKVDAKAVIKACGYGVYAAQKIVSITAIYDKDFVNNNSLLGDAYFFLGRFLLLFSSEGIRGDIECYDCETKQLRTRITDETYSILNAKDCFKQALQAYNKAKELHNGGYVYKNTIQSMHYLEDDFNDGLQHFNYALEKFRLDNWLQIRIENLKKALIDLY